MEYGLIFDMDGLLVNSNPFHKTSWKNFLVRKGYPYSEKLFDEVISGRTGTTTLEIIMGDEIKMAGFKTALATSAPTGNVTLSIKKLGLEDYFSVLIDKNDVTRGKPDPEVYLTTLARLGVLKAHCLVIEDSRAGIQAALGAGLKVIGISTSHSPDELWKEGVSMVIEDFTSLSVSRILNLLQ